MGEGIYSRGSVIIAWNMYLRTTTGSNVLLLEELGCVYFWPGLKIKVNGSLYYELEKFLRDRVPSCRVRETSGTKEPGSWERYDVKITY